MLSSLPLSLLPKRRDPSPSPPLSQPLCLPLPPPVPGAVGYHMEPNAVTVSQREVVETSAAIPGREAGLAGEASGSSASLLHPAGPGERPWPSQLKRGPAKASCESRGGRELQAELHQGFHLLVAFENIFHK